MGNWRKQSGIPYLRFKRTANTTPITAAGISVHETVSFDPNELKVGDIITMHLLVEGTNVAGNPVFRLYADSQVSAQRLVSIGLASSGTRGSSVFKEFYIVSPTIMRQIGYQVSYGIGSANVAISDIAIDITAGLDFIFEANHSSASDASHVAAYSIRVTK